MTRLHFPAYLVLAFVLVAGMSTVPDVAVGNACAPSNVMVTGETVTLKMWPEDERANDTPDPIDLVIPTGVEGKLLLLGVGGDGGRARTYGLTRDPRGAGGPGATVSAVYNVGTGPDDIPPGSTVRFIIGEAGVGYDDPDGCFGMVVGGGGGGTGIYVRYPGETTWRLHIAAGGGGGGWAAQGFAGPSESSDGRPGRYRGDDQGGNTLNGGDAAVKQSSPLTGGHGGRWSDVTNTGAPGQSGDETGDGSFIGGGGGGGTGGAAEDAFGGGQATPEGVSEGGYALNYISRPSCDSSRSFRPRGGRGWGGGGGGVTGAPISVFQGGGGGGGGVSGGGGGGNGGGGGGSGTGGSPISGTQFIATRYEVDEDREANHGYAQYGLLVAEDLEAPCIAGMADIAGVECTGPAGAVVTWAAPEVTDNQDPNPTIRCVPPSGSTFRLGTTTVTCTATDASGNSSSETFTVTVVDTTPPNITCPADILGVECTGHQGTPVTWPAPVVQDLCDQNPTVTCSPPSGTAFGLGITVVTCTARDASGNEASCTFRVQVLDTTPPVVTASMLRTLLWPARMGMIPVALSAGAEDVCDPNPVISVEVWSDEGNGPAPFSPDASGGGSAASLRLRMERAYPGDGRVYLVLVRATDRAVAGTGGNTSRAVCISSSVPIMPVGRYLLDVRRQAAAAVMFASTNDRAPAGFVRLHAFTVP